MLLLLVLLPRQYQLGQGFLRTYCHVLRTGMSAYAQMMRIILKIIWTNCLCLIRDNNRNMRIIINLLNVVNIRHWRCIWYCGKSRSQKATSARQLSVILQLSIHQSSPQANEGSQPISHYVYRLHNDIQTQNNNSVHVSYSFLRYEAAWYRTLYASPQCIGAIW